MKVVSFVLSVHSHQANRSPPKLEHLAHLAQSASLQKFGSGLCTLSFSVFNAFSTSSKRFWSWHWISYPMMTSTLSQYRHGSSGSPNIPENRCIPFDPDDTLQKQTCNDHAKTTICKWPETSYGIRVYLCVFWRNLFLEKIHGIRNWCYRKPGRVYKIWWTWINHKRWLAAGHEFGMSQNAAGDSPNGLICRNWYNWYNLGPGNTHCHKWIGLVKGFHGLNPSKRCAFRLFLPTVLTKVGMQLPPIRTVTTDGMDIAGSPHKRKYESGRPAKWNHISPT